MNHYLELELKKTLMAAVRPRYSRRTAFAVEPKTRRCTNGMEIPHHPQ